MSSALVSHVEDATHILKKIFPTPQSARTFYVAAHHIFRPRRPTRFLPPPAPLLPARPSYLSPSKPLRCARLSRIRMARRAAFAGQLPCVRALLSAGASTTAADTSFGDLRTPLHKAASQGHREVCVALMEAGADPNACDAAGNSALDVLCLSAPILPDAVPAPSPHNEGSSGAAGGGGSEACSIVVLSSGAGKDWGGVREALERHGGRRHMHARVAGLGNVGSGGGGDHHSEASSGCIDPGARSSGREKESASVLSVEPVVQTAGAELGVREPEGAALPGQERSCTKNRSGVDAAAELASTPSQGQLGAVSVAVTEGVVLERAVDKTPRSGGGGVPCGECLLPKVVMVRTTCCGGLICKPCARGICARRQSCRRCRYRGD